MTETQQQLKENILYKIDLLNKLENSENYITWLNENILDIEYIVDSSKNYLGAVLLLSYGGPTIRYNTRYSSMEGYWGVDSYSIHYKSEFIDEIFEEIFKNS